MRLIHVRLLCTILLSIALSILLPCRVFAGNPPDAAHSSLTASASVPADGTTQEILTVTLKDSSGTTLAGDSVKLSAPTDTTASFSPSTATLDASGSATFSVTSTQPGTDAITVTDITTGTTLAALGNAVFDQGPAPVPNNECPSAIPSAAPDLYSIIAHNTSADLYFAPPATVFDGYTISYGLTSDADAYNTTFSEGMTTGAVKYTINNLQPKTRYYFKVRANNGCATGPWSTVVASTQSPTQNTTIPVTGPSNWLLIAGLGGLTLSLTGALLFLVV